MSQPAKLADIHEIDKIYQFPEGECMVLSRDKGVSAHEHEKFRLFRVDSSDSLREIKVTSVGDTYKGTPTRFSTEEGVLHIPYKGNDSISGSASWISEASDKPLNANDLAALKTQGRLVELKFTMPDPEDMLLDGLGKALDNIISSGRSQAGSKSWVGASSGRSGWERG